MNGDGLLDLVCHFTSKLTAFGPTDTLGILRGTTTAGNPVKGTILCESCLRRVQLQRDLSRKQLEEELKMRAIHWHFVKGLVLGVVCTVVIFSPDGQLTQAQRSSCNLGDQENEVKGPEKHHQSKCSRRGTH